MADHDSFETRSALAFHNDVVRPVGFYTLCLKEEPASMFEESPSFISRYIKPKKIIVAHLKWLGVEITYQRQGIGRIILGSVLEDFYEIATRFGVFVITLDSLDDYSSKFYQKLGFQPIKEYPRKFQLPIEDVVAARQKAQEAQADVSLAIRSQSS